MGEVVVILIWVDFECQFEGISQSFRVFQYKVRGDVFRGQLRGMEVEKRIVFIFVFFFVEREVIYLKSGFIV